MRRWLAEPLLHFLVAGGLLFAAYAWLGGGNGNEPRVVRITAADVDWLQKTWTRQWQRRPTDQELRGLVADYLKEELLAREARALGLDQNDTIVRRRLAQKMAFLVEDVASLGEPREVELRELYDTSRARYQTPATVTFMQIYFKTEAAALQGLEALATDDQADLGEPSLLAPDHARADERTVASLFGPELASVLFTLEPERWHGPIASTYGFHLVRISERQDSRQRPFEEVRAQVLDEWRRAEHAEANERFLAELLHKYDVVVDESVRSLVGPMAKAQR